MTDREKMMENADRKTIEAEMVDICEAIECTRYCIAHDLGQAPCYDSDLWEGKKHRYFVTIPFRLDEDQMKILLLMIRQMQQTDNPSRDCVELVYERR